MSTPDEGAVLLRRFVADKSQDAFTQLVRGKIDLVYSVAIRQVGGDVHMAREVCQEVFIDLVRHAPALASGSSITGWLYSSARFSARKAWRKQIRWKRRQEGGHAMDEMTKSADSELLWEKVRPELDEAIGDLNETDRAALLARFFEGQTLSELAAHLGVTENAARMRVERAMDRLRKGLNRRGINSVAAAIASALTVGTVMAAPEGLAASVASASLMSAALSGSAGALAWAGTRTFLMNKIIIGTVGLAIGLATGTAIGVSYRSSHPQIAKELNSLASHSVKTISHNCLEMKPRGAG